MRNIFVTLATLLLLSNCQQPATTNKDKVVVEEKPTPAIPQNQLIVPGKQIGNMVLNAPADTLEQMLGKPDRSDAAMGKAWLTWYGKKRDEHNNRVSMDVYTAYVDSTMEKKTVQQIRTTSTEYSTANGIRVYSDLAAIRQQFPGVTDAGRFRELNGTRVFNVYDDLKNGIAFEIAEANGQHICVGIIVHLPGKKITGIQP